MKAKIIFITLIAFLFYQSKSYCYEKFMHITIKDGLSQSNVKTIHQDYKGFLWIGTEEGLNRYDGLTIVKYYYDPSTPHSVCSNDITCIYENRFDSTLLIGTKDAGISVYNRNEDSFYSLNDLIPETNKNNISDIRDILATGKGTVWLISYGKGIFSFNFNDSLLISPPFNRDIIFQQSHCIMNGPEGNLWIGTSKGLFRWNFNLSTAPVHVELMHKGERLFITDLKFDKKGILYIGTMHNGLLKYNPYTKKTSIVFNFKSPDGAGTETINDILISKDNCLWIGTKSGLFKKKKNEIKVFMNNPANDESINNNYILNLFEDRSGIIWIGTYLGGVNMFDPRTTLFPSYKNFSPENATTADFFNNYNTIFSIYEDINKSIWVNTLGGLLEIRPAYFKTRTVKGNVIKHYDKPVLGNIYYNRSYGLFLAFKDGIYLRKNDGTLKHLSPLIKKQTGKNILYFFSSLTDSDGALWFSTRYGMLKFIPSANSFKLIELPRTNPKANPSIVITITENHEGKLIMGTFDGKLFKLDRYQETVQLISISSAKGKAPRYTKIFSVHESGPGKIWLATNFGLYLLNREFQIVKRFSKLNGQPINVIYGILEDKRGNLWFTSNNGLIIYYQNNETFRHFTYYEGLQSNEFNQSSYFKSEDGTFYIGGIDGMNVFKPEDIQPDNTIPPLIISKLEILYEPVTPTSHPGILKKQICETKSITLSYKQNTFSLGYRALCFSQPRRINYRYMLEGFDTKWIDAGNRRIANYTKVDPGKYTLKVINTNIYGEWRKKPVTLSIIIPPPYWQTIWFKILITLIILSSVYFFFYFKIKNIKYQKALLTATVEEKTKAVNEQKLKIEQQNSELITTNRIITQKNEDLEKQHKQIKEQHDKLINLTRVLKETNQARLRFFTSISHEFRTPLTLIISPLQDILKNPDKFNKVQIIRHLKTVYSNASKLLLLIDQLLDFRKVETGEEKPSISKIKIISFTKQIISLFYDLAEKNNIKISLESSDPEIEITADSAMMEKIITNLLSNAFNHTPGNGEIKINIKHLNPGKDNSEIRFSVSDSGEGIEESNIADIFNSYPISDKQYSKQSSGLGLALVKKYIELHEGTITVKSKPGRGTTFTFTIPADKFEPDHASEKPGKPSGKTYRHLLATFQPYLSVNINSVETGEDRKKHEILIIESDTDLLNYLKDLLSGYFRVLGTASAEKGFQIASSKNPDLIISGVIFKGTDGFDLCKKIRSHFNTSHIPVILISSLSDKESMVKGLNSGANEYIVQPFEPNLLLLKIISLLNLKQNLQKKLLLDAKQNTAGANRDKAFLDKVTECIESNISDPSYNVDQLCECVGISHAQVYRKIKALTNQSISVYIRNVRLKKAAGMLLDGELKINEVAYNVGFSDANYFTKCFTRLYEQTPREFIRNAGK